MTVVTPSTVAWSVAGDPERVAQREVEDLVAST